MFAVFAFAAAKPGLLGTHLATAPIATAAYAAPIAHSYAAPIAHSYAAPIAHTYAAPACKFRTFFPIHVE